MELTSEQQAARAPLVDAGSRILNLLHRVGESATDEQRGEHLRMVAALLGIWNGALVEPIEPGLVYARAIADATPSRLDPACG